MNDVLALDALALRAAHRLAASQPRMDYTIAQLPSISPISSTDVLPLYHGATNQTYGVTVGALSLLASPLQYIDRSQAGTLASFTTLAQLNTNGYTVAAGALNSIGATLRIKASGSYGATGTPNMQMQIRIGALVLLDTGLIAVTAGSAQRWQLDCEVTVASVTSGSAGLLALVQNAMLQTNASGAVHFAASSALSLSPLNVLTVNEITIWAAFSASSSSNTISMGAQEVDLTYPVSGVS